MAGLHFTCCFVSVRCPGFPGSSFAAPLGICPVQVAGVAVHSIRVPITVLAAARICREAGARVSCT